MGKPDDNFFAFADTLLEKINLVSKVIARFEHKIKSTETYMGEEFK